ncbi:MAG: hypothetical protein ACP5H8_03445 [Candidatus Micrarchaeia archaeon]
MGVFESYIVKRFGIYVGNDHFFDEKKNKVYVCSSSINEVSYSRVQRRGMLAGKLNSLYGTKPSLDFVLAFGHLATKNYVVLEERLINELYCGANVVIPSYAKCEDGLVIVKGSDGMGKAVCLNKRGILYSLVQKDRKLDGYKL